MCKWYLLIANLQKACFLWIQCVQQMVECQESPTINMPLGSLYVRNSFEYQTTFV